MDKKKHIVKTNLFNRLVGLLSFVLLATLVAELGAILILDKGIDVSSVFSLKMINVQGSAFCEWIWRMIGPMLFPFTIIAGFLFWSLKELLCCWRCRPQKYDLDKVYKTLYIIEIVAPAFGFWGTCQALMKTMKHIDPSQAQKALLTALLNSSSMAFVTTILGLAFSITAFLSKEIFKDYLMGSSSNEKSSNSAIIVPSSATYDRNIIINSKQKEYGVKKIDDIENRGGQLCVHS